MTTSEWFTRQLIDQYGVPAEKISPDARLVDDLGLDSLDCIELLMEADEAFEVPIPDDVAGKLTTLGSAIEIVDGLRSAAR